MSKLSFVAITAFTLTGCANINSIHRVTKIEASSRPIYKDDKIQKWEKRASARVISVDAKQRHLLINPEDPRSDDGWRVCAEASPDTFSAYASSLGANAGTSQNGGSGAFSSSIAETAATIERTQTVNLLRESMYRTCERYLSGAISKEIFVIQAARDQKSMVSVLAIEQLTGAIRPKSTVITGPSTSAITINGDQAAKLITTAMLRRDMAKSEHDVAALALQKGKEAGLCDTPAEGDEATESPANPAECTRLTLAEKTKADEFAASEANLADATKLAANLATRADATTTGAEAQTDRISKADIDSETVQAVANAVTQIALAPPINETLMWCIATLSQKVNSDKYSYLGSYNPSERPAPVNIDPDIKNMCIEVMAGSAGEDILERRKLQSLQGQ